jgi:hypothetical protein
MALATTLAKWRNGTSFLVLVMSMGVICEEDCRDIL